MKIKIDLIKENSSLVYFSSIAGQGVAMWKGKDLPVVNNIYSVEVEINKMLEELNFKEYDLLAKKIFFDANDKVVLSIQVEDVDDDGVCYFRLSSDCLVIVDSKKRKNIKGKFLNISLFPEDIELYPIGY